MIIGHSFITLLLNYRLQQDMLSWVREKRKGGQRNWDNRRVHLFWGLHMNTLQHHLVPAEWNMSRAISSLLHQGLVEFPASAWMDSSPAIFTVILQTGNVSTEKWSKLSTTTGPLTFITQLIIQDIWLNFHLLKRGRGEKRFKVYVLTYFLPLVRKNTKKYRYLN